MDRLPRPEIAALVAACHLGEPPLLGGRPLDAETLVRLARFHRVVAFASDARERLNLPQAAAGPLRAAAMAVLHRNLQFAAELKLALKALDAADVPVILLKGAHLMDAVYPSLAHRPLSDLDVLIHPEHAERAITALCEIGYHADPKAAAFGLAHDAEVRLDKTGVHTVVIELHTDLNRPTRHHWFPMDAIWDRSVGYPFEGEPARAMSDADSLVFLCAHAVPHAFSQLIWIRDIAGVAQRIGDWDAVARTAGECHARRATFTGLTLARDLLGAAVPDSALQSLLPSPMAGRNVLEAGDYSTLESLRFRSALSDSRGDAASIIAASLAHKTGELSRGIVKRKQKGMADRGRTQKKVGE